MSSPTSGKPTQEEVSARKQSEAPKQKSTKPEDKEPVQAAESFYPDSEPSGLRTCLEGPYMHSKYNEEEYPWTKDGYNSEFAYNTSMSVAGEDGRDEQSSTGY